MARAAKEPSKTNVMDYMTIRECHKKMKALGATFSEAYLRKLVDEGEIPYLKVGNRKMISYETAARIINDLVINGGDVA